MNGEEPNIISGAGMAATPPSSNFKSIPTAASVINPKMVDSDQLKQTDRSSSSTKSPITGNKAKSCKGCLYYSSHFKSDARNPLCVGLTSSMPNVPQYVVGESEMEASKEGRTLNDFRYGCVGYSLYTDRKGQPASGPEMKTDLPVCVGLEILIDRRVKNAESTHAHAHADNREDSNGLPQRRSPKPTTSTREDFLGRFTRNANLVANGVVKNLRRVGNQIKQSADDLLFGYRRPPK